MCDGAQEAEAAFRASTRSGRAAEVLAGGCVKVYWTRPAFVLMPRSSMILYLWKATVPGLMLRTDPILFNDMPWAINCRISYCRGVSCLEMSYLLPRRR